MNLLDCDLGCFPCYFRNPRRPIASDYRESLVAGLQATLRLRSGEQNQAYPGILSDSISRVLIGHDPRGILWPGRASAPILSLPGCPDTDPCPPLARHRSFVVQLPTMNPSERGRAQIHPLWTRIGDVALPNSQLVQPHPQPHPHPMPCSRCRSNAPLSLNFCSLSYPVRSCRRWNFVGDLGHPFSANRQDEQRPWHRVHLLTHRLSLLRLDPTSRHRCHPIHPPPGTRLTQAIPFRIPPPPAHERHPPAKAQSPSRCPYLYLHLIRALHPHHRQA